MSNGREEVIPEGYKKYTIDRNVVDEAMRRIANGEEPHGGFLTTFAEAYCRADSDNKKILLGSAYALTMKYELYKPFTERGENTVVLLT